MIYTANGGQHEIEIPVMDPIPDDFEIITSLRKDTLLSRPLAEEDCVSNDSLSSQLYMLPRHRDRMLAAAKEFGWPETSQREISSLEQHIQAHLKSTCGDGSLTVPLKMRVALSLNGTLNITSTKVAAALKNCLLPHSFTDLISCSDFGSPPTFRIFVSTIPTTPTPFTKHKTTSRAQYDDARSKTIPMIKSSGGGPAPLPIEILIFNASSHIMEGTITTPYFNRGECWITPSAKCGGNLGTTRQYALDERLCREGIVDKVSVRVGEKVVLSNGVRGFGWGIVEEITADDGHD